MSEAEATTDRGPGPAARAVVILCLILLTAGALLTVEMWPMTAWRLFSLARDESQTEWVLEAETPDGSRTVVLEDLPLRFRHAAWPMARLPQAGEARRERVCNALFDPTADLLPGLTRLSIVRDRQQMVEVNGEWVVEHDPETVHTCERGLER